MIRLAPLALTLALLSSVLSFGALADTGKSAPAAPKSATAPQAPAQKHPRSVAATGARRSAMGGGFRPQPRPVVFHTGMLTLWVFSPYIGQYVEVPQNPTEDNSGYPSCSSVQDCGDGELGYGAVCDRASFGLGEGATGVCREACRDSNDCATGSSCVAGLDPDDVSWLGCVGQ